jgi:hypothetical protein
MRLYNALETRYIPTATLRVVGVRRAILPATCPTVNSAHPLTLEAGSMGAWEYGSMGVWEYGWIGEGRTTAPAKNGRPIKPLT